MARAFNLITFNNAPLPKPSQNQITTTTTAKTQPKSNRNKNPETRQITNQITPTEIKAQNPQNNQNHKIKTTHPRRKAMNSTHNRDPQMTNHKSQTHIRNHRPKIRKSIFEEISHLKSNQ